MIQFPTNVKSRPARHIVIPEGATHWNCGYCDPFERHAGDRVFVWLHKKEFWCEHLPPNGCGREGAVSLDVPPLERLFRVKICDGPGWVVGREYGRYLVDLDLPAHSFTPAAFFYETVERLPDIKEV